MTEEDDVTPSVAPKFGPLQRISLTIIGSLERFFYNWGYNVASRPTTYILSCLVLAAVCGLGLITFTPENRPDKLWIPWNSEFVENSEWFRQKFPSPIRFHFAIITANNVLEPAVLQELLDIHQRVEAVKVDGLQYDNLCFRLPVTKFPLGFGSSGGTKKQVPEPVVEREECDEKNGVCFSNEDETETSGFSDPSVGDREFYCGFLEGLEDACWESNLAELWEYNGNVIKSLTQDDILNMVNKDTESPIFGRPVNYTSELGGVTRNSTGHIVGAKAIIVQWFAKINQTAVSLNQAANDLGTGEVVDKANLKWEAKLTEVLLNKSENLPEGMSMYIKIARSFGDISNQTIMGDAGMFAVGFMIVFNYVVFMLGKFNVVEQRPLLSLAGLGCVGLAILVSYGICSAFRTIYGPVHNVLPFLLMGIGIDDMFVIMQCWNNLTPAQQKRALPERMGLTLKHAGVSITVTSVTDFVAFAIGGTTVLPALQSFCLYAALGVIATYVFQATFFVACFALDQKRIEDNRNAFFLWIRYENFQKSAFSQRNFAQEFFRNVYTKILLTPTCKTIVLLFTAALAGVNIYGNILLRQEFNPIWFLPQDSYLFQYYMQRDQYFPGRGEDGMVVTYDIPLRENLKPIEKLVESLEKSQYITNVESWYEGFKNYSNTHFNTDVPNAVMSEQDFNDNFGRYLYSPSGSRYRQRFKFWGNLTCQEAAPKVELSMISFKFKTLSGPEEQLPAMRDIKGIVSKADFERTNDSKVFSWAFAYAGWETDEIITIELYRNMALAMICVLITTLILIANLSTCVMVLVCVVFTLVDVGGMMHFWNLTIDTVSCIDLVLAIGLCVDYAAHIGHAFMTVTGSRNERAQQALVNIGPAVVNGGFSTFLAFVLLANSKSHVFITFFKIFFLVVVFGLFHGLVFLPVLLSLIGPAPYPSIHLTNFVKDVEQQLTPVEAPQTGPQKEQELPTLTLTEA